MSEPETTDLDVTDWLVIGGGGALFILAFLPWVPAGRGGSESAWEVTSDLVSITWPALIGLVAALAHLLQRLGTWSPTDPPLGFSWPQVQIVAGIVSTLITLGWFLTIEHNRFGSTLSVPAAICLLVGAVRLQRAARS